MGILSWFQAKPELERSGANPADLVLVNGRVITCDGEDRRVEAFAVKDGRFVYVGDAGGMADFVGRDTEIIDARNRVVTPGFIDSHCHILWVGALEPLLNASLYTCSDFEDIARVMREHAEKNPDLPFIWCMGWNYSMVPGGVPSAKQLDEVIADRPVVLWSDSAHSGWVNTVMLERMRERNPEAFEQLLPIRDESGEPTGEFVTFWFFEPHFFFSEEELGGELRERMLQGIGHAIDEALKVGVTTYDDVMIHRSFIPLVMEYKRRYGFRNSRVRCTYYINHHMSGDMEALRAFLSEWREMDARESDDHFVIGRSVKMGTDGVPANYTAYMLEPYCGTEDEIGEPSWKPEDFYAVVSMAHELGLQIATHACGDAAIRMAVDAYERVAPPGGRLTIPHRVDHCVLPTEEDQVRMGRLGVSAAMQPAHFWYDPAVEAKVGKERMNRLMPHRSMAERGVRISFGSDWCAGPINPIYGLLLASTRLNFRMKAEWGPHEKISVEEGIKHWTSDSAKDMLWEKDIGSIEVGKCADFVVFGSDPLKVDSWWFLITHKLALGELDDFVDMTFVDGKAVYRKPDA